MSDPRNLQRFVEAQSPVYEQVLSELREGRKRTHWMWFIFPQVEGLGRSPMARKYAIRDKAEARAYLAHEVLGRRLVECTEAVLTHSDRSAGEIFGGIDTLKFRSSMTLFAAVAPDGTDCFRRALDCFCKGGEDSATLAILALDG